MAWMQAARIFALTSESEGLSLALIEALACGLPAVVPDVGELGAVVRNGINGFLVRSRTAEAFGECFVSLLRDCALQQTLRRGAQMSALPYAVAHVGARWKHVLADLRA